MQMCPNCDRVYDESEYCRCPYCSGEIEVEKSEQYYKVCTNCGGGMDWEGDCWKCYNCGEEIYSSEDDYDGIVEGYF